jgi:very-short-patch-repair endonuclease
MRIAGPVAGEYERVLFVQSGVLTSSQAVRYLGRGVVRGNVRLGRWRHLCRGIVLTHNGRLERDQQLWVAVLAAGPGALLAGLTAMVEGGVRGLRDTTLRILIPAARSSTDRLPRFPADMPLVRVHRSRVLPDEHRCAGPPPRTTMARSIIDAAVWARSADQARTVLATACQQRRVTAAEVFDALAVTPTVRRHSLIRDTLADIDGGAHALSEIDLVELCRRHRLPVPDLQERRCDADGRVRYLDAYWRHWSLHAEVDGAHHMEAGHWAADMLRQNQIWISGDRILRFPAWLVRAHPDEVAAQVRAALRAAGWDPLGDLGRVWRGPVNAES